MPFVPADARPPVRPVDDVRRALLGPLVYQGATDQWEVPRAYVTDFATVPPGVAWLVPRTGRYDGGEPDTLQRCHLCTDGLLFHPAAQPVSTPPHG